MKINALIILIAYFTASGCASSKVSSVDTKDVSNYEKLAISTLASENVTHTMNSNKTYVLSTNEVKGTLEQPRNSLSFVVIKINENKVVLEQKIEGGNVNWLNYTEIEVFRTPGIMRDDQTRDDFITIYNVETGLSYPKNKKMTH